MSEDIRNELIIRWKNGETAIYRFITKGDAVTAKMIFENHCMDEIEDIKIQVLEQQPCEDVGELSDGYHTFNQLYHQRAVLFACIVRQNKNKAWKSFKHSDGNYCFDSNGEWFIVGVDTPQGSYTYHFAKEYWYMFDCQELECGKEWDGHTEENVTRLLSLEQQYCDDYISREAAIDLITDFDLSMDQVVKGIHALPPVKPQQKIGHWITTRTFMHDGEYYCDQCKCDSPKNKKWDYCPKCGAKMESESEEGKNRRFKILIKDAETYIKVTKQMDKERIRWVSDGKLASNSEKYRHISKYFPIYLLIDEYNRLAWSKSNSDISNEEYEITPEEYLKNIH